ncbi:MAG TPA: alpha-amylase [Candidatus Enterocloster faecavium]|uniref:Alpha-amylase n=1 Tax=Candidatus Enterocloster faecavium TaxID=2838560 RepID=A0A9D2L9E7_9FIRM|nr:alpha-amylase [Candidatus Enterocloster faecavium]
MSAWYEQSVFYHMYPLGMTGAPRENHLDAGLPVCRFSQLDLWIPHIRDLNFNAVYIGPLFESTSHGYDTRDYRKVDSRLGSNEDFCRFVSLCRQQGIRVVVDGVFNHTGREFFAFQDIIRHKWDSPYKDWYRGVRFDCQSPMGDPFCYDAWQGHFELPCLNLQNPQVRDYLFQCVEFWIKEFDIDGIRLDCANVLDFGFMEELRQVTGRLKEDFWLMGEVIHGDYARWVNPRTLHSVTNYELHKSIYSGFNDHNFFEIAHNVRRLEAIGRDLYTFVDNHDEDRIASKLKDEMHLAPVYMCLYTLPGIPSVYYGGEWAIQGRRTRTSDEALRPAISPEQFEKLHCPLTGLIARLGEIHRQEKAFCHGVYRELYLTNRQYAYSRENGDSLVLTALNNDPGPAALSIPLPPEITRALPLLGEEGKPESMEPIAVENGRLNITLPGNWGSILKLV